jgi:hypothetical protein
MCPTSAQIRVRMLAWPRPQKTIRFTFVRDPIARFVSGYRELEYRYVDTRGYSELFRTYKD